MKRENLNNTNLETGQSPRELIDGLTEQIKVAYLDKKAAKKRREPLEPYDEKIRTLEDKRNSLIEANKESLYRDNSSDSTEDFPPAEAASEQEHASAEPQTEVQSQLEDEPKPAQDSNKQEWKEGNPGFDEFVRVAAEEIKEEIKKSKSLVSEASNNPEKKLDEAGQDNASVSVGDKKEAVLEKTGESEKEERFALPDLDALKERFANVRVRTKTKEKVEKVILAAEKAQYFLKEQIKDAEGLLAQIQGGVGKESPLYKQAEKVAAKISQDTPAVLARFGEVAQTKLDVLKEKWERLEDLVRQNPQSEEIRAQLSKTGPGRDSFVIREELLGELENGLKVADIEKIVNQKKAVERMEAENKQKEAENKQKQEVVEKLYAPREKEDQQSLYQKLSKEVELDKSTVKYVTELLSTDLDQIREEFLLKWFEDHKNSPKIQAMGLPFVIIDGQKKITIGDAQKKMIAVQQEALSELNEEGRESGKYQNDYRYIEKSNNLRLDFSSGQPSIGGQFLMLEYLRRRKARLEREAGELREGGEGDKVEAAAKEKQITEMTKVQLDLAKRAAGVDVEALADKQLAAENPGYGKAKDQYVKGKAVENSDGFMRSMADRVDALKKQKWGDNQPQQDVLCREGFVRMGRTGRDVSSLELGGLLQEGYDPRTIERMNWKIIGTIFTDPGKILRSFTKGIISVEVNGERRVMVCSEFLDEAGRLGEGFKAGILEKIKQDSAQEWEQMHKDRRGQKIEELLSEVTKNTREKIHEKYQALRDSLIGEALEKNPVPKKPAEQQKIDKENGGEPRKKEKLLPELLAKLQADTKLDREGKRNGDLSGLTGDLNKDLEVLCKYLKDCGADGLTVDKLKNITDPKIYGEAVKEEYGLFVWCSAILADKQWTTIRVENGDEKELARAAAQITLERVRSYDELNAKTKEAGDKKFLERTREVWSQFAVHGILSVDKKTGERKILNYSDLDGRCSLALLGLAGINTKDTKYIAPSSHIEGRINLDTGDRFGLVVEDGGKTAFFDHHESDKGRVTSAAQITYEVLTSLGLLGKEKYLDDLTKFVSQVDNRTFPNEEKYFKDSHQTVLGLQMFISPEKLIEFFKEGRSPVEILSPEDLKKLGLEKRSEEQKKRVESSLQTLEGMKEDGLIIDSKVYGRVAIDIGKRVVAGFDAAKAAGCGCYVIWNPRTKSFFVSTTKELQHSFSQGFKVRETMWIKPINKEPLRITLGEIVNTLTDGQEKPQKKLAEVLAKEKK